MPKALQDSNLVPLDPTFDQSIHPAAVYYWQDFLFLFSHWKFQPPTRVGFASIIRNCVCERGSDPNNLPQKIISLLKLSEEK